MISFLDLVLESRDTFPTLLFDLSEFLLSISPSTTTEYLRQVVLYEFQEGCTGVTCHLTPHYSSHDMHWVPPLALDCDIVRG